MIIAIMGRKRSGKDTVAERLKTKYNFHRYAFADPIKEACRHMFGFTEEQLNGEDKEKIDPYWNVSPRKIMQVFGTEFAQYYLPEKVIELSKIGRYFWVHRFLKWFKDNQEKDIAIPDCRFIHEVESMKKLKEQVPVKIIKVVSEIRIPSSTDMHPSEVEFERITDFDSLVINDTTISDLNKQVDLKVGKWIEDNRKSED